MKHRLESFAFSALPVQAFLELFTELLNPRTRVSLQAAEQLRRHRGTARSQIPLLHFFQ